MSPTPALFSLTHKETEKVLTVAEELTERLRARILDGELVAGQRLIEADIIEEFDVGRSAVRDALKHLEAKGLVDIKRQKGASVVRFTKEKLAQLFAIRERLEGFGCYLAAGNSSLPKNRSWLLEQKQSWQGPEMVQSEREHMATNVDLHEGLILMSGNPYLKECLERLQIPAYRQRFVNVIGEAERQHSCAQHLKIINAVLSGDQELSEKCMREHVRETALLAASVAET